MYYYEQLENGNIGRYTNNAKLAQKYGWTGQTDTEPTMYNSKLYLVADFEAYKQTDEYKALQKPPAQEHEQIDPAVLDLAEAVLDLSAEIEKIKGDTKQ